MCPDAKIRSLSLNKQLGHFTPEQLTLFHQRVGYEIGLLTGYK